MNTLALFQPIKVFVFDIDGVLTDGRLLVAESGEWLRSMYVKDGFALKCAADKGYAFAFLSGGQSAPAKKRLEKIGLTNIYLGVSDKLTLLQKLVAEQHWKQDELLYMGDDIPDLPCLDYCGLATCPKDAAKEVQAASDYISPFDGGWGCVRDVIEKVLKLQDNWPVG